LNARRKRGILTRDLVQRRIAGRGEADTGAEAEHDHPWQHTAHVGRVNIDTAGEKQARSTAEESSGQQWLDADARHQRSA